MPPLTARSNVLKELQPVIRRSIVLARVPQHARDDAMQMTLHGLTPYVEKLQAMEPKMQAAYAYRAATLLGYKLRDSLAMKERGRKRADHDAFDGVTGLPRQALDVPAADGRSPQEDYLLVREADERVATAVSALDAEDVRLFAHIFDEEMSERQIAERLQISRGAVVRRARTLREQIRRAWLGTTSWFHSKE